MSEVRIICSQVDKCGRHCSHRHLHLEVINCTQEACPNFDGQALCIVAEPTFLGDLVGRKRINMQVICPKANRCKIGFCIHKVPHLETPDCFRGCASEGAGACVEPKTTFLDDYTEEEDG